MKDVISIEETSFKEGKRCTCSSQQEVSAKTLVASRQEQPLSNQAPRKGQGLMRKDKPLTLRLESYKW